METTSISSLKDEYIGEMVAAFKKLGWGKSHQLYDGYLEEQTLGKRLVHVIHCGGVFVGYCTLKWQSLYPPFECEKIPEVSDLNVLPQFRNQGLGTRVIRGLEDLVRDRGFSMVGIGVGMTADYGAAQRLYVRLGYVPDGRGLSSYNKPVNFGSLVPVDDDLVLWSTKRL